MFTFADEIELSREVSGPWMLRRGDNRWVRREVVVRGVRTLDGKSWLWRSVGSELRLGPRVT